MQLSGLYHTLLRKLSEYIKIYHTSTHHFVSTLTTVTTITSPLFVQYCGWNMQYWYKKTNIMLIFWFKITFKTAGASNSIIHLHKMLNCLRITTFPFVLPVRLPRIFISWKQQHHIWRWALMKQTEFLFPLHGTNKVFRIWRWNFNL